MPIKITKRRALEAYGGNAAKMCADLGIDRSNAPKWEDDNVPEKHVLNLIFVLQRDFFEKERKQVLEKRGLKDDRKPELRPTLTCGKS